ncbi:MAG: LysM peptidoglycan-binding domain-containing protein [Deltaproteobacteria bacterium]|nr:LysM peptidoglycan-binding domain-containing protein [Deltaproteobacteria bacterium]
MKKVGLGVCFFLCLFVQGWTPAAEAVPVTRGLVRSHEFYVPDSLRRRVDFWIDVFTKYGKHQVVVHHRLYPWLIFEIFDFSKEAQRLNPVALDVYSKKVIKHYLEDLNAAFKDLASGQRPTTALQGRVETVMRSVPGGPGKYRRVLVEDLLRTQTGIKEKWMVALKRSGRYIHLMEDIFRAEHLPIELTRLPFIESSFDYYIKSSAGAVGLWQFMPRTGKEYLTINYLVDERRDVVESTRAAARYLRSAYRSLGSWPLAITSYNHGVGGVRKKVRDAGTDDITRLIEEKQVFGFASSNFYPELLAALEVYDHYQFYFPGLKLDPPVDIVEATLPHATGVEYLCKQLQVDKPVLQDLNHALSSAIWSGRFKIPKGYNLKLPRAYAARLNRLRIPEPVGPSASSVYGGTIYQVRQGDTLSAIARRHEISVGTLMKLNGLKSTLVKPGQRLAVKQLGGRYTPSEPKAAVGRILPQQKASTGERRSKVRQYRVAKGDSLWSISRKFGVKLETLKKSNALRSTSIKPGQVIIIP